MIELVLLRDDVLNKQHQHRLAAKLVITFAVLNKTLAIVILDLECKTKTARESIVSSNDFILHLSLS